MMIGIIRALAVLLLAACPVAHAQPATQVVPTIGILTPHQGDPAQPVFFESLRKLGYQDGKNVRISIRSAESNYERLPALAKELVEAKVDVIVAINTPGAAAAIRATKSIPIVMAIVGDPVGTGFVSNLACPGGNVTGISNMSGEIAAKRLSILKELVPGTKRIALLNNPVDPVNAPQLKDTAQAAPRLGIEIKAFPVKTAVDLAETFKQMLVWRADSALWLSGQASLFQAGTIELAAKHRLPVMVASHVNVQAGGLVSYFADQSELYRRTAIYVDKILKGAKPGDLPVEQPSKLELAINLKTAKALGLVVPQSIMVRADHVVR